MRQPTLPTALFGLTEVGEFLSAAARVAAGGSALDPKVVARLVAPSGSSALTRLSERERDVLALMAEGLSNSAIANRLVVSDRTVEAHVRRVDRTRRSRTAGILAAVPRPPRQLTTLKTTYARAAQAVGRGLTRVGLLPDEAPPRSNRWRHWAFSLTRVHDSGGIADLDVPWWTYGAIDAVQAFIDRRQGEVRAFEWGSGASTIWLARRVTTVDSVEHHRGFGEMMVDRVGEFPNASVSIVEPVPSDAPVVPSLKEGQRGMDFADYVAQMELVAGDDGKFDLVVIDGRAREACLAAALPRLTAGGIVVFDNSWRVRYRRAIKSLPVDEKIYRGLTPTTPYPEQTSLITGA